MTRSQREATKTQSRKISSRIKVEYWQHWQSITQLQIVIKEVCMKPNKSKEATQITTICTKRMSKSLWLTLLRFICQAFKTK